VGVSTEIAKNSIETTMGLIEISQWQNNCSHYVKRGQNWSVLILGHTAGVYQ